MPPPPHTHTHLLLNLLRAPRLDLIQPGPLALHHAVTAAGGRRRSGARPRRAGPVRVRRRRAAATRRRGSHERRALARDALNRRLPPLHRVLEAEPRVLRLLPSGRDKVACARITITYGHIRDTQSHHASNNTPLSLSTSSSASTPSRRMASSVRGESIADPDPSKFSIEMPAIATARHSCSNLILSYLTCHAI